MENSGIQELRMKKPKMDFLTDDMAFSSERISNVSRRPSNFFMLMRTASGTPF
jgi:hypothetical protein